MSITSENGPDPSSIKIKKWEVHSFLHNKSYFMNFARCPSPISRSKWVIIGLQMSTFNGAWRHDNAAPTMRCLIRDWFIVSLINNCVFGISVYRYIYAIEQSTPRVNVMTSYDCSVGFFWYSIRGALPLHAYLAICALHYVFVHAHHYLSLPPWLIV